MVSGLASCMNDRVLIRLGSYTSVAQPWNLSLNQLHGSQFGNVSLYKQSLLYTNLAWPFVFTIVGQVVVLKPTSSEEYLWANLPCKLFSHVNWVLVVLKTLSCVVLLPTCTATEEVTGRGNWGRVGQGAQWDIGVFSFPNKWLSLLKSHILWNSHKEVLMLYTPT